MPKIIKKVTVAVHTSGQHRATVEFTQSLSKSDPIPDLDLDKHWGKIRSAARTAIVNVIASSDQRAGESLADARARARKFLSRLAVSAPTVDRQGRWHSVSFVNTYWAMRGTKSATPVAPAAPLIPEYR
ncbi:MAG: hypothetical protein ABWX92_05955 [Mycetocola sp.]